MLTLITQQHFYGCAPACLATLTGMSYKEALKAIYPWKKIKAWEHCGTDIIDLLRALKRIGLKYKEKEATLFAKLRTNAIVVVEHPSYGPPGDRSHSVVWDHERQRILDPNVGREGQKRHLPQTSYQKCAVSIIEIKTC